MSAGDNKAIVLRYYQELWNRWDLGIADEIIAADFAFRGSLSVETTGLQGFKEYVRMVRRAFPDFQNIVEDLIAEEDKVVARLTYRGTHQGEIFGAAPTGRRVTYSGIAIFRIRGLRVREWVNFA